MKRKHFIQVMGYTPDQLMQFIEKADQIVKTKQYASHIRNTLHNKTIVNLFFEPSTRTRTSFELAARRLGASTLTLDVTTSSMRKGESLTDMIASLLAMHVDGLIIRHSENHTPERIVNEFGTQCSVINAGDGTHAHPTQALLDMLTIYQRKKEFHSLTVALVGDVLHSRVANSDIEALKILGTKDIRAIGPKTLLPYELHDQGIGIHHDLRSGLKDVDVIIVLRLQKERMQAALIPDEHDYFGSYGLTEKTLKFAKPDAIVMHPGPIQRGVDIAPSVVNSPQSMILDQIRNGVAMRMVLLEYCLI